MTTVPNDNPGSNGVESLHTRTGEPPVGLGDSESDKHSSQVSISSSDNNVDTPTLVATGTDSVLGLEGGNKMEFEVSRIKYAYVCIDVFQNILIEEFSTIEKADKYDAHMVQKYGADHFISRNITGIDRDFRKWKRKVQREFDSARESLKKGFSAYDKAPCISKTNS